MSNEEIIKEIRQNFERLSSRKNSEVKSLVNTISRQIGRLHVQDKELSLTLLKISEDLRNMLTSEKDYFDIKNKTSGTPEVKTEYSESFFESLNVLKEELYKVFTKL